MEYRNARVIWNNLIDCEINHPVLGWIPFTADQNDTGADFDVAALYQTMLEDPSTIPWDGKPQPVAVPFSITRRQCAMQLFKQQIISGGDAISMTQTGVPPAAIQAYFDTLPEPDRTIAIMDFAAVDYYRNNPLINSIMTINNMSSEDVDNFFIAASEL